ncbi:MAG: HEAT repeat domain-containing protein, partial [Verrucomicrobia bacterium]|nr:HEAT repeat domain-containing protein [Verrucomicrobiota bacterium]
LGAAAATEKTLGALVALSQDAKDFVRRAAAYALGRLGAAAATEKTLGALVALSQDAKDFVRSAAADALGSLGAAAASEPILAALIDFWTPRLAATDYVYPGRRWGRACDIAFEELKRLATFKAAQRRPGDSRS